MRVLIIGGCLGLGSLVAQALMERGIEVVEDDEQYWRSQNPHLVRAEEIGLFCRTDQFSEPNLFHSDLWRDRAVVVWYPLPDESVHHRPEGWRKPAEKLLSTHVIGTWLSIGDLQYN